ncbi:endolytic transglycosylase MltG [Bacteroidota bacterium]
MTIEKLKSFFQKVVSGVKIKSAKLYSSFKNSTKWQKSKGNIKKAITTSKEKFFFFFSKVRNSSFYKKSKVYLHSVPPRLKELSLAAKSWMILILQKSKESEIYKKTCLYINDLILPPLKNAADKFKYFLDNTSQQIKVYVISKPLIIFPTIIFINILLIFFIVYQILFAKYHWEGEDEKRFIVTTGKTLTEVTEELKENDLIRSSIIFKLVAKVSGKEENILARNYIFKNDMSNIELLTLLTDISISQTIRFTVIEGLTLKQIADNVEKRFFLSSRKFLKEAENDSLLSILGLEDSVSNLEGFLFPDTYIVPINLSEKYLVEIMFDEFLRKVWKNEKLRSRISEEDTNILKVVTLASIIQAETPLEEEKPIVSGVYHNRLKKRMRLEADPTVQYILPDGPKKRLLYSDLKIDSPYNTYMYFGLPPGPINNPGLSAINGALNPKNHNYLFFVASGNGGHIFTETFGEHLRAVQKYRNKLKNQNNNK